MEHSVGNPRMLILPCVVVLVSVLTASVATADGCNVITGGGCIPCSERLNVCEAGCTNWYTGLGDGPCEPGLYQWTCGCLEICICANPPPPPPPPGDGGGGGGGGGGGNFCFYWPELCIGEEWFLGSDPTIQPLATGSRAAYTYVLKSGVPWTGARHFEISLGIEYVSTIPSLRRVVNAVAAAGWLEEKDLALSGAWFIGGHSDRPALVTSKKGWVCAIGALPRADGVAIGVEISGYFRVREFGVVTGFDRAVVDVVVVDDADHLVVTGAIPIAGEGPEMQTKALHSEFVDGILAYRGPRDMSAGIMIEGVEQPRTMSGASSTPTPTSSWGRLKTIYR